MRERRKAPLALCVAARTIHVRHVGYSETNNNNESDAKRSEADLVALLSRKRRLSFARRSASDTSEGALASVSKSFWSGYFVIKFLRGAFHKSC